MAQFFGTCQWENRVIGIEIFFLSGLVETNFYLIFSLLGFVWIGLILLRLKIYCWNHCSKIIFKCINSTVRPIFNEKIAKKWNLWIYEQYMMYCLRQKSQHLLLLFIKQYMNSNHVLPKYVEKKKKQKHKTQTDSKDRRVSKLTHIYEFWLKTIARWYLCIGLLVAGHPPSHIESHNGQLSLKRKKHMSKANLYLY